jgi:PadR family transcriptional regulator AphA
MATIVSEQNGVRFVECTGGSIIVSKEKDAMDLLSACASNQCRRILLHSDSLSSEFFDLKTGLAGSVLQKFINYKIRAAAIIPVETIGNGRFFEMVAESNRGSDFRVFQDRDKAVEWLVSGMSNEAGFF